MSTAAPPARMAEIIVSHVAERSVLNQIEARGLVPYLVAGRRRIATCSGVAWFRGHHLAVVNLYGGHLRIYRFEPGDHGTPRVTMLHEMCEGLSCPEHVAASPDGALLAVSHSLSDTHGISLHHVDEVTLAPRPVREMLRVGHAFHGLSFSPDSRHLVFTEVGTPGYVEVLRAESTTRTCRLENAYAPLKPKGVAFSADGRFLVVALAPNVVRQESEARGSGGMLAVHRFDLEHGIIEPKAVSEVLGSGAVLYAVESCAVLPPAPGRPCRILAVDQAADLVAAFDFSRETGTLAPAGVFAAGMSFPHGIDVSADGTYVAVTNYGDDTLRILRVAPSG
jgi:hypothetical protein